MKKVAIIGHFAKGHKSIDGQTIKTLNLSQALSSTDKVEVCEIDTYGWKKHPLRLIGRIRRAVRDNDAVIMLPAHNGVRVFSSLLLILNRRRKKKLYYDIVGAWLPSMIEKKPRVAKALRKFDGLWAETQTMKSALDKQGFENVTVVPNFKDIKPISESELNYVDAKPLRLVIFSRISEKKGVTDAVEVLKKINANGVQCTLDIYGPVEDTYSETLDRLVSENSTFVTYGGVIDASRSVSVLKDYHALLFPTKYYTEGIPGTIIDAYCAGLPVICSRWESCPDICIEGVTSLGYEFANSDALLALLEKIVCDPSVLDRLRFEVLAEGSKYTAMEATKKILSLLGV